MSHHNPVLIFVVQIVGSLAVIASALIGVLTLFGTTALLVTVGLLAAAFIAYALYDDNRETKKLLGELDDRR